MIYNNELQNSNNKLQSILEQINTLPEACIEDHTPKYTTALVIGDGTNIISFNCPFTPDCFFVTAHGASVPGATYAVQQMAFDARSFARYGGMYRIRKDNSNIQGTMAASTGGNYFKCIDGVCTIECPASLNAPYIMGAPYVCVAVKYTDKSDKELLEDEIALLTNETKTIEYSKTRINATVTDAEWSAMTAHLNNITFSLK